MGLEAGERTEQLRVDFWHLKQCSSGEGVTRQWESDAGAFKEVGVHRAEGFAERSLGVLRAGAGVDDGDGFVEEWFVAHEPVEGILQGAGYAVSVFRGAEEESVGGVDGFAQRTHRGGRRSRIEVGIKMRQVAESLRNGQSDTGRSE